ncbi:heavy metal translocating P-type ATPase [Carboxydochorda subterranea]|uniref:Heavy metal translocating P-type ATPase n=1 Tax=Carboxydichorda subterranea TaxID=3109565 RepID=A0ABZ1BV01_9FIRM|nr:heavy metal translocating P-type ATPase [Limnochorda sp. L945t]WRP16514.1 heavy metal translocating P-type ATPase [Limnochorda sp. L945t]
MAAAAQLGSTVTSDRTLARFRPLAVPLVTGLLVVAGWWLESRHAAVAALTSSPGPLLLRPGWAALVVYALAYLVGGYESARTGWHALRRGRIDIDFLMVAAALGAAAIGQALDGAILIFIFALSNALEEYATGRTRKAIEALVRLRPTRARRVTSLDDAAETELITADQLRPGEFVLVLPGEQVPADGVVVRGISAVDTSAITGESIPQQRQPGDQLFAGSVNREGALWLRVERPAQESTLARIIQLVEQAQQRKAPTQLFIERFEQVYSALVVAGTVALIAAGLTVLGWGVSQTIYRAMTVMVVASPCAVVLSTMPVMLSAIASGARNGVLFKGALDLEQLAGVRVVAFDKTGTLTLGLPQLVAIHARPPFTEEQLLAAAAAAESGSEHPIAGAILEEARRRGLSLPSPEHSRTHPGRGVEAVVSGDRILVGSPAWFHEMGQPLDGELADALARLESAGHTAMVLSINGSGPAGILAVADRARPHAREAVQALQRLGLRVVMLTGDNERVAQAMGRELGVDEVYAGLLPEDKMRILQELERRYGPVAMVGDGINDAPALVSAAVGIAMGRAGTDVALETADVVLMSDELVRLEGAVALGRRAERVVRQNLAFAFGVIAVLLVSATTGHLSLTQGVVGHETSTVLVALNGLRLLGFRWPRLQGASAEAEAAAGIDRVAEAGPA